MTSTSTLLRHVALWTERTSALRGKRETTSSSYCDFKACLHNVGDWFFEIFTKRVSSSQNTWNNGYQNLCRASALQPDRSGQNKTESRQRLFALHCAKNTKLCLIFLFSELKKDKETEKQQFILMRDALRKKLTLKGSLFY